MTQIRRTNGVVFVLLPTTCHSSEEQEHWPQ